MQRYFAKEVDREIIFNDEDVYHICKVMRCRLGDEIEVVCDNKPYVCSITSIKPFRVKIVKQLKENKELKCKVILICALLKSDKLDFVIQKATELGVSEIVFMISERTIVKVDKLDMKKFERYLKIAKEASEQCHRTSIPAINRFIHLNELNKIKADIKLIPYEEKAGLTKSFINEIEKAHEHQSIAIVIGPEGGFAEYEVNIAKDNGYVPVSLGKRILRAETASIYAMSVTSCLLERD